MNDVLTVLGNDTRTWNKSLNARLIEANEVAKITGNTKFDATVSGKDDYFYFDTNNVNPASDKGPGTSKYKWLFDYTSDCTEWGCSIADSSTSGYWTSTPSIADSNKAWNVYSYGFIRTLNVSDATRSGVRPVITIKKSVLDKPIPTPSPTATPTPEVCTLTAVEGKSENGIIWTGKNLVNSSSDTGEYSSAGPKTMFKGHFMAGKTIRIYFIAVDGYTVSPNMQPYIILDDGTEVEVFPESSGPTMGYIDFTMPKTVSQFNYPLYFSGQGSSPGTTILKVSMNCG